VRSASPSANPDSKGATLKTSRATAAAGARLPLTAVGWGRAPSWLAAPGARWNLDAPMPLPMPLPRLLRCVCGAVGGCAGHRGQGTPTPPIGPGPSEGGAAMRGQSTLRAVSLPDSQKLILLLPRSKKSMILQAVFPNENSALLGASLWSTGSKVRGAFWKDAS